MFTPRTRSSTATTDRLPSPARAAVEDLLGRLDHAVPGRVEGFYVVGSACLGAFRPGRSDVDFVAIVDRALYPDELTRLRAIQRGRCTVALVRDVALRRRWPLLCNGTYLRRGELARSPLQATAVAGQVAGRFGMAQRGGFDLNPVTWHTLARHGIAVRGPEPNRLEIRVDPAELRAWTLENLDTYWRRWATHARRTRPRAFPRHHTAGGVLGVSRLHYTLATGEVAGKEAAGEFAVQKLAPVWRPLIEDALAYWRGGQPALPIRQAAAYVDYVIGLTARSV